MTGGYGKGEERGQGGDFLQEDGKELNLQT